MLNSPPIRTAAKAGIAGIGRPRLNLAKTRSLGLLIPPSSEQHRIVSVIEEQFSRLDAAEVFLRRANDWLGSLRRLALAKAIPIGANYVPASQLAEVRGGIQKQPKRRPTLNHFPFLRVANVGRGSLDLTEIHEVELFNGELQRYRLEAGDLLVVEGNGSPEQIGRSALWQGRISDTVYQNHLIRVRPGPKLDPEYLNIYWNTPETAERLRSVASSTSGLYTLSTAKVKSIPIPVIPICDQRRIVAEIKQQLTLFDSLRTAINRALKRSRQLRRAILERASLGKLVPQDPIDEPASILLKRIGNERAALEKVNPRRPGRFSTVKS